jgi:colanic acid biosynthesis glycosyl transferase WcaI
MRVLILNQAFYPDVVSTAQHASDLARALAELGDEVTVIASRRGYDDPSQRFARHEQWNGIHIHRVSGTALGKTARWRRAADFASYLIACAWKLLSLRRHDTVVALTSPPLISFLAALLVPIKARRLVFWSMDLNPDEAIAAGWLRKHSRTARTFSWMLRYSLRRAQTVVALDRFMAERIESKRISAKKIVVLPPWSHDDDVAFTAAGRERFRKQHGLENKFVVMYSGNHSPCHPLQTLLEASTELREDPQIRFCFVGGGSEMQTVKRTAAARNLSNVVCIPYQPRHKLAASLSAADLHAVVMGNDFVGIVHPCKVYNVLLSRSPVLYIGPEASHVTELLQQFSGQVRGHSCRHGDVAAVLTAIAQERHSGERGRMPAPDTTSFSKHRLVDALAQIIHGDCTAVTQPANADVGKALVLAHHECGLAATADK